MARVSVVMAVHNGACFLEQALASVLGQTLPDFELIVVDDGSTDETPAILTAHTDQRLRVVRQTNGGQYAALNRGLQLAGGEFVARQDADDVWLPGRLKWQVQFLDRNPDVGAVGAQAVFVDAADRPVAVTRLPTSSTALRWHLLFESPFVHSTVLMKREVLRAVGSYRTDDAVGPVADYELWSRIARVTKLANAPFPLVLYRDHVGAMSKRQAGAAAARVPRVRESNVEAELGDRVLAKRASRHARTLRLEEVGMAAPADLAEAVDSLLELEAAFLGKYEPVVGRDPIAAAEIRGFTAERLIAAASRAMREPMSRLARRVCSALVDHLVALLASRAGAEVAMRLGFDVFARLALGRRYHVRSASWALRAALRHPVNHRPSMAAATGR